MYIYAAALFLVLCVSLTVFPATGKIKLGRAEDTRESSSFSWFSMMFGAGIGIGMLTFATAEPMYHFVTNPNVIIGEAQGYRADNVPPRLCLVLPALGFLRLGLLRACRLVAGLFCLSPESPHHDPVSAHANLRRASLRLDRAFRRYHHRRGNHSGVVQTLGFGALPFSFVMVLMGIALIKVVIKDLIREKNGGNPFTTTSKTPALTFSVRAGQPIAFKARIRQA